MKHDNGSFSNTCEKMTSQKQWKGKDTMKIFWWSPKINTPNILWWFQKFNFEDTPGKLLMDSISCILLCSQ
jgi:hypothetical protein